MDKMLRACLNWKVIGSLTVLGFGLWSVAPNLLVTGLPLLLLAACPLSMMLMMRGMKNAHGSDHAEAGQETGVAPSTDLDPMKLEAMKLEAMKAEIDQRIQALKSAEPEPPAGQSVTVNGEQRT